MKLCANLLPPARRYPVQVLHRRFKPMLEHLVRIEPQWFFIHILKIEDQRQQAENLKRVQTRVFNPIGPILLIAGFFAVPILAAAVPDLWGFVAGNTIIGTGWVLLGWELAKSEAG